MLLAVGDRYEPEIAAARRADAEIPLNRKSLFMDFTDCFYSMFCAAIWYWLQSSDHCAAQFMPLCSWFFRSLVPPASGCCSKPNFGDRVVLVYVGAVMVLFLFVVMMLDINMDKLREGFWGVCLWLQLLA